VTRYDLFRRRIAPIAFGVAIALLAREQCVKQHRTHATIVLDLGSAAPQASAVDADLFVGDESIAHFHRVALPGGTVGECRFETALPADDGELHIDVTLGDGSAARHVPIARRFHASDGGTVTVPLGDALAEAPGPVR
jgi:hypothetical protein